MRFARGNSQLFLEKAVEERESTGWQRGGVVVEWLWRTGEGKGKGQCVCVWVGTRPDSRLAERVTHLQETKKSSSLLC